MKTVQEVSDAIAELINADRFEVKDGKQVALKKSVLSARRKKVQFLKVCKGYLESNPTNEFMEAELTRLNLRIKSIEATYPDDKKFKTLDEEKEFIKDFNKKWDIPHLKTQVKTIKFLLK